MGWLRFDTADMAEHEGWVVAIIRDGNFGHWRELRLGDHDQEISHVQVGCECGWRSPRMIAPIGTRWAPCIVLFPERHGEDHDFAAADIWSEHIDDLCHDSPGELLQRVRRRRGALGPVAR